VRFTLTYEIHFDWQDHIVDKLASRHAVETWEVEECFFDSENKKRRTREGKMLLYGRSSAGRYLFVVYVVERSVVRVISARDMTDNERRLYRRK
jgi:uncharacterized DUF497 family protein